MEKEIKLTPFYYDHVLAKPYTVIIQVGGRFSSKSYNSQIELAMNLGSKNNYNLLVIEDLEKSMIQGYYAGLVDKIEQFEHTPAYDITKSPPVIKNNINGNKALFMGYSSDQQKKSVKALDQITEILIEEGEWLSYDDFIALLHQLRGGEPSDRKLTVLMNPVNEYCFVNEMFIQSVPDKVIEYFPSSRRPKVFEKNLEIDFELNGVQHKEIITVLIVLSTHHDNPYLTNIQRASIEVLRTTDPEKYKQLGEARFIKSGGSFFSEFDRDIHVIEPHIIPESWTKYASLDYGLDMLAVLWHAVDPQGNVVTYKELHEPDLIVSKACERIKQVMGTDKVYAIYAPSDLESRTKDTGTKITELFRQNGINLTMASNKREQGWLTVKEALKIIDAKDVETGKEYKTSRARIFNNCQTLIKHISQVQRDEANPNDVATQPHYLTHIVDAYRYYTVTRFNSFVKIKEKQKYNEYDAYAREMSEW